MGMHYKSVITFLQSLWMTEAEEAVCYVTCCMLMIYEAFESVCLRAIH